MIIHVSELCQAIQAILNVRQAISEGVEDVFVYMGEDLVYAAYRTAGTEFLGMTREQKDALRDHMVASIRSRAAC